MIAISFLLLLQLTFWNIAVLSQQVSSKVNITIGILGIYCSIPRLKLNGSLITNYNTTYDPKLISTTGYGGFTFFGDAAVALAVEDVNNSSTILPGVNVKIKRFSDCGSFYQAAVTSFTGRPSGFAPSIMSRDLTEVHTDVIGVVGGEISATARASAEALSSYQIPYCSWYSGSPLLDDRNMFPYFFRMFPSSKSGNPIYQFLKANSVRQVGIIYQKDSSNPLLQATEIVDVLQQKNVIVAVKVALITKLTSAQISYAINTFNRSTVRYIISVGSADWISKIIYPFGKAGLVGPNYVWITTNNPRPSSGDPLKVYGTDFYSFLSGVLLIGPKSPSSYGPQYYLTRSQLNLRTGFSENDTTIFTNSNAAIAYDCTMLVLLGIDKLIKLGNPANLVASRGLQASMNLSLFQDLGYESLKYSIIRLTNAGNMQTPFVFSAMSGDSYDSYAIGETDIAATSFTYYSGYGYFFNGSTIAPTDGLPRPFTYTIDTSFGLILVILSCIGLVVSLLVAAFFAFYQRNPIVRVANVPECLLVVAGSILIQISILLYLTDATSLICQLRMWSFRMGYNIMISTLLCKNLLVSRMFSKNRVRRPELLALGYRLANATLIAANIFIMVAMDVDTKVSLLPVNSLTESKFYISCSWPTSGPRMILDYYQIALLVAIIPCIYLIQKVHWETHNESSLLAIAFVAVSLSFLIITSFDITSDMYADFKMCLCIWLSTVIVVVLLVGPRLNEVTTQGTGSQSRSSQTASARIAVLRNTLADYRESSVARKSIAHFQITSDPVHINTSTAASSNAQRESEGVTIPKSPRKSRFLSFGNGSILLKGAITNDTGGTFLKSMTTSRVESGASFVKPESATKKGKYRRKILNQTVDLCAYKFKKGKGKFTLWLIGQPEVHSINGRTWLSLYSKLRINCFWILEEVTAISKGNFVTIQVVAPEKTKENKRAVRIMKKLEYQLIMEFQDENQAAAFANEMNVGFKEVLNDIVQ